MEVLQVEISFLCTVVYPAFISLSLWVSLMPDDGDDDDDGNNFQTQ